jgi:hypothetical protein
MPGEKVSSSIADLQAQIDVGIPATAAKWEIFETPEYTGGVPAPTDFVTLVAELENVSPSWKAEQSEPIAKVWVAPEVLRSWLSPASKTFLQRANPNIIELNARDNCSSHSAKVRKSGRVIEGFVCVRGSNIFLYLTLRQP